MITIDLPDHMSHCHQLSKDLFCCNQDYEPTRGTHCYFTDDDKPASHLVIRSLQMTKFWQILSNEGALVIVKSRSGDYHVIDTASASIFEVKNSEHSSHVVPKSFFFSMETSEELSELARSGETYVICQFLKDNNQHYRLAGDEKGSICGKTRILPINDLGGVKFCANPVYQAVIHYDKFVEQDDYNKLRWHLQVSYNDDDDAVVYRLEVTEIDSTDQLGINCEPTVIEVYIVANQVLIKYTIFLPREDATLMSEQKV
ncbi:unnamed protein product [Enterobius vermicularis]|uniref:DUF223 domain-containing protein n=1 Tax=Enterobius vermicularis TaxID=51028 RepID=A0A0N4V4J9_ENTVE|nr:unnamed protein product [Enterobius vermicularis]